LITAGNIKTVPVFSGLKDRQEIPQFFLVCRTGGGKITIPGLLRNQKLCQITQKKYILESKV
jgi:hypothetical protein